MSNDVFDEAYYRTGCGPIPYGQGPEWAALARSFADNISAKFAPRTLLDAGCALGLLIGEFRQRGVQAWGIDISRYAEEHRVKAARPFCVAGSLSDEWPAAIARHYDVITCIEVLEHMAAGEGDRAIAQMCSHADTIIFSSTPDDTLEPTHINVQSKEYWVEKFAAYGFRVDNRNDVSFVTPWAVCFRGGTRVGSARIHNRLISKFLRHSLNANSGARR